MTSALYFAMGVLFWFIGSAHRQDFDPVSSSSSAQIPDAEGSSANPISGPMNFANINQSSSTAKINNGELKVGYNAVDGRARAAGAGVSNGGGVTNVGFVAEDVGSINSERGSTR